MPQSYGLNPTDVRLLAELGGVLATGTSEEDVLEALVAHVAQLLPFDRASLARFDQVEGQLVTTWLHGLMVEARQSGRVVPLEGSLGFGVFASGDSVLASETDEEFALRYPQFKPVMDAGINSVIAVPLRSPEMIFGTLHFQSLTPGQYDEHYLEIAEAIGVHLGSTLTSIGLREELSRELKEHSAIADIVQIVNGARDIEPVYDRFATAVGELVPTDRIVVSLVSDDGNNHYDAYVAGTPIPEFELNALRPLSPSSTELMIRFRHPMQIDMDAISGDGPVPDWIAAIKRAGLGSVIAAPLIQDGNVFGSVQVRSSIESAYTEREVKLVGEIAAQISGAIANSRLRERLEREVAEGEILARNGVNVSGASSVTEIGDAVAEDLKTLMQFDHVGIGSLDPGGTTFRMEYLHPRTERTDGVVGKNYPLAGSATGVVTASRDPVTIGGSVSEAERSDLPVFEANLQFPLQASITFPLISNGIVVGSLTIGRKSDDEFTPAESSIIERLTGGISGPVANAILRRQLARDANEHRVFAEISRVAADATSISEIGEAIARAVPEILRFRYLSISRVDPKYRKFWSEFFSGMPDRSEFEVGRVQDLGGSLTGAVLESRQPIILDLTDADALQQYPKAAHAASIGMTSAIGVPLISNGKVIGVLILGDEEGASYIQAHSILAERAADQIAGSVANLGLREELQKQSLQRQALADLGRVTSEAGDMKSIGDAVRQHLAALLGVERVAIARALDDGESLQRLYSNSSAPEVAGANYPRVGSFTAVTLQSGEASRFGASNREEMLANYPLISNVLASGFSRAISAPLIADGSVIGNLMVGDSEDGDYEDEEVDLVARVAAQIAGAVANIGLRDDLEEVASEREILAEIGRVASEAQTFGALGRTILPLINRLVPSPRIELRTISSDQKRFTVIFSQEGVGPPSDLNDRDRPFDQSGSGLALLRRAPIAIGPDTDVRALSAAARSRERGFQAGVHAPLISTDEVVGFLVVDNTEERDYLPEEINLLGQISQQIAGPMASLVLRKQLELESTERQALADIGRAAITSDTAEEMGERTYSRLKELVEVSVLSIGLIDSERQNYSYVYSSLDDGGIVRRNIPLDGSLAKRAIDAGELQAFGRSNRDELLSELPRLADTVGQGLLRGVLLPLMANDQIIGAMLAGDGIDDDYTPDRIEFLSRVADQVAGAINNIALRDDLERESSQTLALAEISRAVSRSLDFEVIGDTIFGHLSRLMGASKLIVRTVSDDGETVTIVYANVSTPPGVRTIDEIKGSFTGLAITTGERQMFGRSNRADALENSPQLQIAIAEWELARAISLPLIVQDRVVGALMLGDEVDDDYSQEDGEFAQRIADQISGAFALARQRQSEQREADIQELLNRVATAATGGLDPALLFDQIEEELRTEFECDRFEALLAGSDGETLRFACVIGIAIGGLEQGDIVPAGVQTLRSWGPILERTASDSPKHDDVIESGLNSWIQVPIGFPSDAPIGFIGLRALATDAYTEDDGRTLARIAAQITPAMQNARTHQQSIELAAERERSLQLERQAGELQRLNEEKSQFLETVTHELKTPLTSIQAFRDILLRNRDGNLTNRQIRNLDVSSRNARQLGLLIDDLVDVSQIQTGSFELTESEFDLVGLTNDLVESMQPILAEKQQELRYQLNSSTIWLRADRARIAQVITNLLSNASKYSPDESAVVFCVGVERSNVLLEIQDDGSGIAEEDMPHLFTPLFRADNEETRAVPGTGIGLAIVKQIVDAHGGEIDVSSQLGIGTKFKVEFPRQVTEPSATYLAEQKSIDPNARPRSRLTDIPPE